MRPTFSSAVTLAAMVAAGLITLAATPGLVVAQLEQTPILGPPALITPLVTAVPGADDAPAAPPSAPEGPEDPGATAEPRATATVGGLPDRCEPNDTPEQRCPLPLDAVSGPFTFVPEDDRDYFLLDLPQDAAIQTDVTVRGTRGLDLVLSARQGTALLASGVLSLTLAPDVHGPVVLRVENRDPRPSLGETYRIEVRRSIAPPGRAGAPAPDLQPDALENNWSFASAAPIAVGVVYDLSLVCPEARRDACPGGDHDYLLAPVKAGVTYLVATFDLDPGVDTVVEIFWRAATPAAGSDDAGPGGMLSALTWTAPADGLVGVRVAPRNGGVTPRLAGPTEAGYRFVIAPVASELARKLEATIRQQAGLPTPTVPAATAIPAGGGTGGAGGAPTAQESIAGGPALIVRASVLRREPSERATALAELAPETQVTVRGPVSGLWVSVEAEASILPGWVRWSDLRRDSAAERAPEPGPAGSAGAPAASPSASSGAPAQQPDPAALPGAVSPTAASRLPTSEARVTVTQLDPALPPPPRVPAARVPLVLTVIVAATDRPPAGGSALGFATPTPDLRQPVARVRVQLLTAFGDVLAEGLTDDQGAVALSRDVRPGDALRVRMPAWGVELPLATNQTSLIITVPETRP